MQEEFENKAEDIIKAKNGNEQAMTDLIEKNKGLIWNIVKRFQGRGYEIEDLYQVGAMGFIKCIKRFDSSFEVKLSTYAVPYILGEVKRYIRDNGPIKISRSLKEMATKVMLIKTEYYKKSGKEIKIEEMANILKISKEELSLVLEAVQPVDSIDEQLYDESGDGMTLLDKIGSQKDEASEITNRLCIEQIIKNLKDQEREVILLRYYRGKTQTEIAKILGITQVQVSRIERKTLELMKMKLAG